MKRPGLVVGAAILVIAVGAASAWLTRLPETAPLPRLSQEAPSAATEIALPKAVAPPEPTSADFARSDTPSATATAGAKEAPAPPEPADWAAVPIDELRNRANADEVPAMEELARRLVHGGGVAKDQQAGAGWLLRAAQRGSAQSAFNVGVMYERGFVVERNSTKAIEWYRKAVEANLPMAKHNLALLLRDGKGAARNSKEAAELLRSASRQGMTASMFTLGDMYERGDAGTKDQAMALAWFAIAGEFERQTNRGTESALAKMASQRAQALQRVLMPGELERAQQFGQGEFKQIVEALQPPKPAAPATTETTAAAPTTAESDPDPPGWPKAVNDQVRAIQQALVDLRFLRDKPDGAMGPMTRNAIRAFQRSATMRETGEPTRDVFAALQDTIARRDVAARAPSAKAEAAESTKAPPSATVELGKPEAETAKAEAAKVEAAKIEAAKAEAAKADAAMAEAAKAQTAKADTEKAQLAKVDPPKPPMPTVDDAKPAPPQIAAAEPAKAAPAAVTLVTPEPLPPPTSSDIARAKAPSPGKSSKRDPDAWPTATVDQVKAIQGLLRELNFSREAPDGQLGPATRAAIRDYERSLGLAQTGEPSKVLYESLTAMRSLTRPN